MQSAFELDPDLPGPIRLAILIYRWKREKELEHLNAAYYLRNTVPTVGALDLKGLLRRPDSRKSVEIWSGWVTLYPDESELSTSCSCLSLRRRRRPTRKISAHVLKLILSFSGTA